MRPHRQSELYRLAVGLCALGVLVLNAPKLGRPAPDAALIALLVVSGVLAEQFPVNVNLTQKVSVASAIFFATALLLPPFQAATLIGAISVLNSAVAVLRRAARTRERPPVGVAISLLFNAGQLYFAVLAAAGILAAAGVSAGRGFAGLDAAVAIIVAATAMHTVNLFLVAGAVALGSGRNPIHIFMGTHRAVVVEFAALYLSGAGAAFALVRAPWLLLLFLLPLGAVYGSLQRRRRLRREVVQAIERMADEVDRRDPNTFHHSQRVAIYAHVIARKMRLRPYEIDLVELAAKVHDVGKIRIPDSVLLKPGKLTSEERQVMETHPRLGFEILKEFSEYAHVLELVLTHHERYDGRGYPNQAVGRRLPLIAQIIPVADSLDAMTSARAYRGARSWQNAIEELRRGAGTQWNPQVVAAAVAELAPKEQSEPVRVSAAAAPTA
ncbi:MAG TPA: HD domain-containing phosphohydrolase [Candidatus Dormibacteraeota bacterium]|nr:HD domain-containing phosphohydrolase [Candidatus Dormibacteraeota bacterium]